MRKIKIAARNKAKIDYLLRNRGAVEDEAGSGYVQLEHRLMQYANRIRRNYPTLPSEHWTGCRATLVFLTDDGDFLAVIVKAATRVTGDVSWYLTDIFKIDRLEGWSDTMMLSPEAVEAIVIGMAIRDQITSFEQVTLAAIGIQHNLYSSEMAWRENILRALFADLLDNPTVESAIQGLMTWARLASP